MSLMSKMAKLPEDSGYIQTMTVLTHYLRHIRNNQSLDTFTKQNATGKVIWVHTDLYINNI